MIDPFHFSELLNLINSVATKNYTFKLKKNINISMYEFEYHSVPLRPTISSIATLNDLEDSKTDSSMSIDYVDYRRRISTACRWWRISFRFRTFVIATLYTSRQNIFFLLFASPPDSQAPSSDCLWPSKYSLDQNARLVLASWILLLK